MTTKPLVALMLADVSLSPLPLRDVSVERDDKQAAKPKQQPGDDIGLH